MLFVNLMWTLQKSDETAENLSELPAEQTCEAARQEPLKNKGETEGGGKRRKIHKQKHTQKKHKTNSNTRKEETKEKGEKRRRKQRRTEDEEIGEIKIFAKQEK